MSEKLSSQRDLNSAPLEPLTSVPPLQLVQSCFCPGLIEVFDAIGFIMVIGSHKP